MKLLKYNDVTEIAWEHLLDDLRKGRCNYTAAVGYMAVIESGFVVPPISELGLLKPTPMSSGQDNLGTP